MTLTERCGWVLTAGSLAQHLDASLRVALGLLQLALVGVGGRVRAAHGRHQRRAFHSLADALGLGEVRRVTLAHSAEAAQHPPASCETGRKQRGLIQRSLLCRGTDNACLRLG